MTLTKNFYQIDWKRQYQPNFSLMFDEINAITVTGTSANELNIITYIMPRGYEGVIKFIGYDATQPYLFNNAIFNLRIDQQILSHWNNVVVQKGSIISPTPETIFLDENRKLQFNIIVNGSSGITFPLNVACRIKGWRWLKNITG